MKKFLSITLMIFIVCASTYGQKKKRQKKNYYLHDSKTATEIHLINQKLEKVSHFFIGHFTNKKEDITVAANDATSIEQELIGRRIWKNRKGEIWIYIGWFKADLLESPMSTTIGKFTQIAPDSILLEYYDFPNPEKYIDEWKKKEPFKNFKPKNLLSRGETCGTYFIHQGNDEFRMEIKGHCRQTISSTIEYCTIEGTVKPEIIDFKTKFYDKDQVLLFELSDGNSFKRLDKSKPKYK